MAAKETAIFKGHVITKTRGGFRVSGRKYSTLTAATAAIAAEL